MGQVRILLLIFLPPMLIIILIFVVGLTPAAVSAYLSFQAERAERATKGHSAVEDTFLGSRVTRMLEGDGDLHYVDGMGYMIGDITCDLNARSPYLRCAINPMGPCDGCNAYAPKVFDRQF